MTKKNIISESEFKRRVQWPLDRKIKETQERIELWAEYWGPKISISFSGGLDSTVLIDLVRTHPRIDGGGGIPVFFSDTGTEYPDIRRFVRTIPGVIWVRPKMKFHQVIKKYGYPVVSKRISQYVGQVKRAKSANTVRLRLTGFKKDGTYSQMSKIPQKWHFLIGAPFLISDMCCEKLKKAPLKNMGMPLVGIRAAEAKNREKTYMLHGCNAFHLKSPRSWPMAFWTDADVKEYIAAKGLDYCPIYDMGYSRTGCFPCALGVDQEPWPNRFQLMEKTHPKIWNLCMDRYGLQAVFEWMNEFLPKKQQISFRYSDYSEAARLNERQMDLFEVAS